MDPESKLTVRIERELYQKIHNNLYHGQQTLFIRKIFRSLEKLIHMNKFNEVLDYLYNNKDLTLPKCK